MLAARSSPNPIFDHMPHLGFLAGDQVVHFVLWRDSNAYNDWQEARTIASHDIVTSGRIVRQRMGTGPWTLETGLWFRDREAYQLFLLMSRLPGTLRMNADYTMHRDVTRPHDRQVVVIAGKRYAEFDGVHVMEVEGQTFANDGSVLCQVTFERSVDPTQDHYGLAYYS